MSEWMLYVYKQFAQPTATGVPVSIDATDPNGNYIHIGDTTSDSTGRFHYEFTPAMAGQYTVYATFMGSKSFYPSFAQNELSVMQAPVAPTPTSTPIANPPYELYSVGTGIAVIIAVAIVGLLLLRKRA
jgi:hypothetical protein